MRKLRPTPAGVIACLALAIALGGSAVAATTMLVPRNSVGTAQVINGSLLKKDFKRGQLPRGPQGPQGPAGPRPKVTCKLVKHNKIQCTVTFPKHGSKHGIVRLAVSRGGKLVALGHARVNRGRARLTMRELRARSRGAWRVVVVFSRTVKASTNTVAVSIKQ